MGFRKIHKLSADPGSLVCVVDAVDDVPPHHTYYCFWLNAFVSATRHM
mgnify:CR=1 FL=1